MATNPSPMAVLPTTAAFRVFSITEDPGTGAVEVSYGRGLVGAPVSPGGGFSYSNMQILQGEVREFVLSLTDSQLLWLFLAITQLLPDGTFKDISNPTIYSKIMELDPAAAQVLRMVQPA